MKERRKKGRGKNEANWMKTGGRKSERGKKKEHKTEWG